MKHSRAAVPQFLSPILSVVASAKTEALCKGGLHFDFRSFIFFSCLAAFVANFFYPLNAIRHTHLDIHYSLFDIPSVIPSAVEESIKTSSRSSSSVLHFDF